MTDCAAKYTVETGHNGMGWSYIVYPDGRREGPIRYRWEAEEWAEEMNNGREPPPHMRDVLGEYVGAAKEE